MRKLIALLSLLSLTAHASVTIPYTFSPGGQIKSSEVNADFSAVASEINAHENASNPHQTTLANILSLSNSCGSNSIDFNDQQALNMLVEHLSADPVAGHEGRMFVNTTTHLLKYDDGSTIQTVGGTGVNNLDSVLNSGNSAGAHNLDMNGNQILSMLVENRTSDPTAAAGRLFYRTDTGDFKVCSGVSCTALGGAQSLSSVMAIGNSVGSTDLNFNQKKAKNVLIDPLAADPGSPLEGQFWYNTTTHIPKFYNGTSSLSIGNTNTLAQTLALGATTGGAAIDFAGGQAQHMVVWNNAGSPGTGTPGYLFYNTSNNSLNYETASSNRQVCSLDGTETITNHTIDGASNTLTNIQDSSLSSNVVLKSGSQTITGTKTFSGAPVMTYIKTPSGTTNGHQVPDGIADDTFVLANATQTLSGKTLAGATFSGATNFGNFQSSSFRVETRTSNPTAGNAGRIYFNSNTGELRYDDGTSWRALSAGGLASLTGSQLTIAGVSDVVTASIQGYSTQTNDIFQVLKSDASNLFAVNNSGGASANYFSSYASNPATAGVLRLATGDGIDWRNFANSGNVALAKNASDQLTYAGTAVLSNAGVLLSTGFPTLSGDVTTPGASLATTVAKIAGTTVSGTTGSGNVVFSAGPTLSGTVNLSGLTASQAVFTDASKNLVSNAISGSGNVVMSSSPTITTPTIASILSGTGTFTPNTTGTITVPNGTDTLVTLTGSQTLTTKTLTQPNLTTPTINGQRPKFITKTANYTLTNSDQGIFGDASGGTFTLTLPTAVGNVNQLYTLVKNDSSGNAVQIATTSSQTINGAAASTYNLSTQYQGITLWSDGTEWKIVSRYATALPLAQGGTGQVTKAAAFDALQPMTTAGDLIYGGASGTGTRLAVGGAYKNLISDGTNPTWSYGECTDNGTEGAGTTTLTIASNPCQLTTLSAARTYTLPTTSVPDGYKVTITNQGDFALTINASGGATVGVLNIGTAVLMANKATPTAKADWIVVGFKSSSSYTTTFTFNGTGCGGGATSTPATTVHLQRDKDMVTISINGPVGTSCTNSNQFNSNTNMPTQFFPTVQEVAPYNSSRNNGGATASAGGVFIFTSGGLRLVRDTGGTVWSAGTSCGFQDAVSYTYYSAL